MIRQRIDYAFALIPMLCSYFDHGVAFFFINALKDFMNWCYGLCFVCVLLIVFFLFYIFPLSIYLFISICSQLKIDYTFELN